MTSFIQKSEGNKLEQTHDVYVCLYGIDINVKGASTKWSTN